MAIINNFSFYSLNHERWFTLDLGPGPTRVSQVIFHNVFENQSVSSIEKYELNFSNVDDA